jgi:hypothetical protein
MLTKKKLLSAIAGLTMMAMPISALASDYHHHWNQSAFAQAPAIHNQPRANFWRGNGFANNNPRFAFVPPNNRWNRFEPPAPGSFHTPGWGWNSPSAINYPPGPPAQYGYFSPPREYAYAPPPPAYFGAPPSEYFGNGYGYGYGGNLMTMRDRLLAERAGAYQQLAIRERAGDTNGAHHLWNTIHSLNGQLARVNSAMGR